MLLEFYGKVFDDISYTQRGYVSCPMLRYLVPGYPLVSRPKFRKMSQKKQTNKQTNKQTSITSLDSVHTPCVLELFDADLLPLEFHGDVLHELVYTRRT